MPCTVELGSISLAPEHDQQDAERLFSYWRWSTPVSSAPYQKQLAVIDSTSPRYFLTHSWIAPPAFDPVAYAHLKPRALLNFGRTACAFGSHLAGAWRDGGEWPLPRFLEDEKTDKTKTKRVSLSKLT